ncbi:guanylate-binding protein 4 isoform X2 [Senna tora]|uniref:Guanylate-binding protein 4 isoform X2 n=1 Tax=Senna tora TaxID=362788 RepID=A0A834SGB6_9FABA|nr:guanylate-binding protein 4 isoform X2 [Senna tora]
MGKSLNGKEFVSFMEQILEALNKGDIPSTGSLVEGFRELELKMTKPAGRGLFMNSWNGEIIFSPS